MEDVTIPGWVLYVLSPLAAGLIAWLVWLTIATFTNRENIAINTTNEREVHDKIEAVSSKVDEVKTDFKEWFTRLENKLDIFISQENQFLKNENAFMKQWANKQ